MPKALFSPSLWHYASVGVGLVLLLALQSGQWFFFDEWAFLEPASPGLFEPHVGHWSTSPLLVYKALVAVFGLNSYLPFAVLVVLIHLAIAHLVWRIAIVSGAAPWVATLLAAIVVVLGTGAENILWAFQIGFLGAIALGLLALLLASRPTLSRWQLAGIIAISVFSLSWSGTSIPLVAATAFVLWRIHGWRRALVHAAISASVYLSWYAVFAIGSPSNPDTGGLTVAKLFVQIPQFIGVMLILGFGSITPVPLFGFIALLGLAAWIIVLLVKKRPLTPLVPAFALLFAAMMFALMSAYSRAGFSVGSGRASRYIYVLVVFLLPLSAVAISRFAASRLRVGIAAATLGLLGLYQGVLLTTTAIEQSQIEQESKAVLSASLQLYIDDPDSVNPAARPEPVWAPDLDMAGLIELYEDGRIEPGAYTEDELDTARANLGLQAP